MVYGLENTSKKRWGHGVNKLVLKVKDTINKLYDELASFMGFDIGVQPSTTSPPPKIGTQKKCKWDMRFDNTQASEEFKQPFGFGKILVGKVRLTCQGI